MWLFSGQRIGFGHIYYSFRFKMFDTVDFLVFVLFKKFK